MYQKPLLLLDVNLRHSSLRLHKLKGKLKAIHSASVTLSCRITLSFALVEGAIVLIGIGSHDVMY